MPQDVAFGWFIGEAVLGSSAMEWAADGEVLEVDGHWGPREGWARWLAAAARSLSLLGVPSLVGGDNEGSTAVGRWGGYLYCAAQAWSGRSHARRSSRLLLLLLEGQRACVMDSTAIGFAAVGAICMMRRRARSEGRLLVALLGQLIYFL